MSQGRGWHQEAEGLEMNGAAVVSRQLWPYYHSIRGCAVVIVVVVVVVAVAVVVYSAVVRIYLYASLVTRLVVSGHQFRLGVRYNHAVAQINAAEGQLLACMPERINMFGSKVEQVTRR